MTRPRLGLACALALAVIAAGASEATSRPGDRSVARTFRAAVGMWQTHVRPRLAGHVRCRYAPTCSEYAAQAVARFGSARGLALAVRRIASCRREVRPGTPDPVPAGPEGRDGEASSSPGLKRPASVLVGP